MDNEPPKDYDEDECKPTPVYVELCEWALLASCLLGITMFVMYVAFAIFSWEAT
jgi:hypothetical protein